MHTPDIKPHILTSLPITLWVSFVGIKVSNSKGEL